MLLKLKWAAHSFSELIFLIAIINRNSSSFLHNYGVRVSIRSVCDRRRLGRALRSVVCRCLRCEGGRGRFREAVPSRHKMGPRRYIYLNQGTCVNVGCIPKKLFHYAGLLGESKEDLKSAGWQIDSTAGNSWQEVSERIQDYIRSLNFGYRKKLNT